MITRIWHGRTKKENAEKYRQYVIDTGIANYLNTDGNLDVKIWQGEEKDVSHIFTVTEWDDIESVKKFVGEDISKAKYYPEDEKYLLELEEKVRHYESQSFSRSKINNYIRKLEELYKGENWTDENFIGKLSSQKTDIYFKQPKIGKHSVAELLWHCIYWRKVILKRMQGDQEFEKKTEKEQNFLSLERFKKKGFDDLLREFQESQTILIDFLKSKNDSFLTEKYKKSYKIEYLIEGMIFHEYYHLGQIGLIISLLNS